MTADLGAGVTIAVDGNAAHYLLHVMRLREGDAVLLFNGRDGEWAARAGGIRKRDLLLTCDSRTRPLEPVPDFWLLVAPVKKGRIDLIAEKACELGVARLLPVQTARSVVDRLNLDRLHAQMVEAAEQCGRTALPALCEIIPLATVLAEWQPGRALFFADEAGDALPAREAIAAHPGPAALLVGPEGGFTPEERAAIRACPAAVPLSLGPRILRAETAAMAGVSVWMAVNGDWTSC